MGVYLSSCDTTFLGQLWAVAGLAFLMHFYLLFLMRKGVQPYLDAHPLKQQFININKKVLKENYFIDVSSKTAENIGVWLSAVLTQHCMGALLCIPAVFGFPGISATVAARMARYGGLLECGWEVQDSLQRAFQLLFCGKEVNERNAPVILILCTLHHLLGLLMVIPMNVYFGDSSEYHELVFLLQGAAFVAQYAQMWGYLLDVTKSRKELLKLKISIIFAWVMIVYSRLYRFIPVGWSLYHMLKRGSSPSFARLGGLSLVGMLVINTLMFLDVTKKLLKWVPRTFQREKKQQWAEDTTAPVKLAPAALLPPVEVPSGVDPKCGLNSRSQGTTLLGSNPLVATEFDKADSVWTSKRGRHLQAKTLQRPARSRSPMVNPGPRMRRPRTRTYTS